MAQEKISRVKLWVFCLLLDNEDVCGIILCVDFIIAMLLSRLVCRGRHFPEEGSVLHWV